MFDKMLDIAAKKLSCVDETVNGLPVPQVTVLLTYNDHIYVAVNDVDGAICEDLIRNKDTKVVKLLTMWKDGGIDVPSQKFRTALIKMAEDNNNTDIILNGKDGYLIKKIGALTP